MNTLKKTSYRVYAHDRSPDPPAGVDSSLFKTPAGEYESLHQAIAHAESVTYGMHVLDESGKVIHDNRSITCRNCSESWDAETIGFSEAKQQIKSISGQCPACEHCDRRS